MPIYSGYICILHPHSLCQTAGDRIHLLWLQMSGNINISERVYQKCGELIIFYPVGLLAMKVSDIIFVAPPVDEHCHQYHCQHHPRYSSCDNACGHKSLS